MGTKLILTDLDETLLHSDKTISDYSVRVFNECKQRGILVGFCTSRGKTNIVPFEKRINPDISICNGGASITLLRLQFRKHVLFWKKLVTFAIQIVKSRLIQLTKFFGIEKKISQLIMQTIPFTMIFLILRNQQ